MPMKDPLHPGRTVRNTCLDPLDLSVTAAAAHLGVAHHTLSRLLNGQAGISPEMAIRLEMAGWSNAETWIRLQANYELAQARQYADQIHVERYEPA
jgi:addiction module HigA family antidote